MCAESFEFFVASCCVSRDILLEDARTFDEVSSLLTAVTKTMQLLPPGDSPYVSVNDTPCPGYVDTVLFLDNCFASMVYHVVQIAWAQASAA